MHQIIVFLFNCLFNYLIVFVTCQAMMHLQQQQQQQQLLATQNGALFGSQTMFTQSPATTSSAVPSESVLPVFLFILKQ